MDSTLSSRKVQEGRSKIRLLEKRMLGRFYTPDRATRKLCEWAIRNSNETVLEPSFGGCGFLRAAETRLLDLGVRNPFERIFGCDIDSGAFAHLSNCVSRPLEISNFIRGDFLELSPQAFGDRKFDVIIGNPPYVSRHQMSGAQRRVVDSFASSTGFAVPTTASLWLYFVVHSFSFLKPGGRVAWILPNSLLYSNYAADLRGKLAANFSKVSIFALRERLFLNEGTEEASAVLLAEGYGLGPACDGVQVAQIESLQTLDDNLAEKKNSKGREANSSDRLVADSLPSFEQSLFSRIEEHAATISLGEAANVEIGFVTGANRFFVLSASQAATNQLPSSALSFVFAKGSLAKGLSLKEKDFEECLGADERCLLLDTSGGGIRSQAVRKYLDTFELEKREAILTFKKREVWHQPDDGISAHAFFVYMNNVGPKIVLNGAGTNCTNSIYRIQFKDSCSRPLRKKLIAISLLTTFSQISAEFEGRKYGAGVLKHEPSEAKRIRIHLPTLSNDEINFSFRSIDKFLRHGQPEKARALADQVVHGSILLGNEATALSRALGEIRKNRCLARGV